MRALATLACAGIVPAAGSAQAAPAARELRIPLRDGAQLVARFVAPPGRDARAAILVISADSSGPNFPEADAFAGRGYAVVVAAVRQGPLTPTGRDGYDAVEWIAKQPWSGGKVVMAGSGDAAVAAWATAIERPPHLSTIIPRAESRVPTATGPELARVAIPILAITDSHGARQGATIDTWTRVAGVSPPDTTFRRFLVIGSLGHDDLMLVQDSWFQWATGQGNRPQLLAQRVNYLVAGGVAGSWRSADSLGAIGTRETGYPLHRDEGPATRPGFLGGRATDDEPADSIGVAGRSYLTGTLPSMTEIVGRPTATLWISGAEVGGLEVTLEEVSADGSVVLLGRSAGKLRTFGTAGAPSRWEFSGLGWVARRVDAGARLQLTVRTTRPIVLLHDQQHYSRIVIPTSTTPGG